MPVAFGSALQQFVDRMAAEIATEINILDPEHVLIGSRVPNMAGFPRDLLSERIAAHTRKPYPTENLEIIYTGDEPEKGVIEAAYYARENMTGITPKEVSARLDRRNRIW